VAEDGQGFSVSAVERDEGLVVVALAGELDFVTGSELSRRLGELSVAPEETVVLDITEVTFVDSTGLNQLVAAATEIERREGTVVFAGASPHVARVFDVVRLGDAFRVVETLADARSAITRERVDERHAG
jgi:anti-anti-sigma factor